MVFNGGGSDVVDLLFNVFPIVCVASVFVFALVCILLCPFYFCYLIDEIERASCFPVNIMWLFLALLWVVFSV